MCSKLVVTDATDHLTVPQIMYLKLCWPVSMISEVFGYPVTWRNVITSTAKIN